MKTHVAFIRNSILNTLKTGSSVFAKAANSATLEMLLAVVLVLAKVGHIKNAHSKDDVKQYANAAIDTSMCLTLTEAMTLILQFFSFINHHTKLSLAWHYVIYIAPVTPFLF